MLSAGSQTVLPTVRFSSATTVVFTTAANNCAAGRFREDVRERLVGQTGPEILFQFLLVNIEMNGDEGLKAAVKTWRLSPDVRAGAMAYRFEIDPGRCRLQSRPLAADHS